MWGDSEACVEPTFMAELKQLETFNARMRRGLPPVSREYHSNNVTTRTVINSYLALSLLLTALVAHNNDNQALHALNNATGQAANAPAYTFGTFSSGGCLDALSCLKTGMQPIWGTETCEDKRSLWKLLTNCPDLGDTFSARFTKAMRPNVLWSGQPCMDYSLSG